MITPEVRKHRIEQMLEHWEARYNGDNDLIPDAPVVTASDMAALDMIRDLLCLIEELQDQIEELAGATWRTRSLRRLHRPPP